MSSAVTDETALTDREWDILQFIESFILQYGFTPSLREIMTGMEISSTSVASYSIRRLEHKGILELQPNTSRGIRLLASSYREPDDAMVTVPLLRRIIQRPGLGVPPSERKQAVPINWIAGAPIKDVYAVEMYSERLYDAMVNAGDVIVLLHQHDTREGDTVLTTIQSKPEPRIRRIYYEGDAIRLAPLMGAFQAQSLPKEQVQVVGKVLGLLWQTRSSGKIFASVSLGTIKWTFLNGKNIHELSRC